MRLMLSPVLRVVPLTAVCLALSAPLVRAQSSPYLTIGDPAPALRPAKWVKGTPAPQFEKGKLYVVEFWATWCGPCKANIPHLTELSHKYKDKVSVIGISIWENAEGGEGDYMPRVTSFVKSEGAAMDYTVAADDPKNSIADSWMVRAGEKGIPCSFIVDRDGKVAWIGYPAQMDSALEQITAGTYDPAPLREKRETQMQYLRPIDDAMATKNYPAAAAAIEKAVAKKPELFYSQASTYLVALYHSDLKKGMTVSRKILTDSEGAPGAYQMISSIFATQPDLTPEAYKFGVGIMDEAIQKWPQDFLYTAMKADVVFRLGDKAQAIQLAQSALDAAKKRPEIPAKMLELIQKNIARYKEAK